jgi:hypothetical protein
MPYGVRLRAHDGSVGRAHAHAPSFSTSDSGTSCFASIFSRDVVGSYRGGARAFPAAPGAAVPWWRQCG